MSVTREQTDHMMDILEKSLILHHQSPTGILTGSHLIRFVKKFQIVEDGCWMWTSTQINTGYGIFTLYGRKILAHVLSYEAFVDSVPKGLVVDHYECDTPLCVNPLHLLLTTNRNNVIRGMERALNHPAMKDACQKGHPFDEGNTYISPQGWRLCRACRREQSRIFRYKKRMNDSSRGESIDV